MIVYGKGDRYITNERTVAIGDSFKDPFLIEHAGGHYVPAGKEVKEKYIEFFERVRAKCEKEKVKEKEKTGKL